ncbi:MAG: molybdate transporter family protein [Bacillota bacterium]
MYRWGDYEFSLGELSGAMGDFGTFFPIAVSFIVVNGMHPTNFWVVFGLTNILTGLIYRAPMPLQPMKAIAAVAIANSWAPELISATALSMGLFWLLLSGFSGIDSALRKTPEPVVRGIQLALGLSLGWTGLKMMMPHRWWLGVISLGIIFHLNRRRRRNPAPLVLLSLGVLVMAGDEALRWSLTPPVLPAPVLPNPLLAWKGFARAGAAQIPLTLTNAVVACAALLREYFPHRDIPERRLMRNMGVMNLVSSLFGSFPMCHGAGGLASTTSGPEREGPISWRAQ